MKILWITPECPYPPNSGGRMGVWKRIEYLSKLGNEIILFCIGEAGDDRYKENILDKCKEVRIYERNCKIISIINSIKSPYPVASRLNPRMILECNLRARNYEPDVIMVDFPQMIGIISDDIFSKTKVVLNEHNIENKLMRSIANDISNPVLKAVFKITAWQMAKYEDNIYRNKRISLYTFVSSDDKKYFERKYNNQNTYLVPVGSEIIDKRPKAHNFHNVLFVAQLSYPANEAAALFLMENIWGKVKEQIPDATLYIVGKNPTKKIIECSEKYSDIIVTGAVESVDEYYNISDVVIIPISTGGGVKVKLIEALAYGALVITSNECIKGTGYKNGRHLLVASNTEDYINKCIEGLMMPDKYFDIRVAGWEYTRLNYSWENIIKGLNDKLLELKSLK